MTCPWLEDLLHPTWENLLQLLKLRTSKLRSCLYLRIWHRMVCPHGFFWFPLFNYISLCLLLANDVVIFSLASNMNLTLITHVFRSGFCSVIGRWGLCSSWEVVGTSRLCCPYSSCHCQFFTGTAYIWMLGLYMTTSTCCFFSYFCQHIFWILNSNLLCTLGNTCDANMFLLPG